MKNTALTLITGLALATATQAGTSYSSKGKEVIPPPPAAPCLWTWFAGGSVGHVTGDWDEEIYTLHVGAEYKCPTSNCSHAIFLEAGYTEKNDTFGLSSVPGGPPSFFEEIEAEIIPITLNYKYECSINENLSWYIGAGAGIALFEGTTSIEGNQEDTVFYAHAFAGLTYNISESFELFAGAKYIFMDDPDFFTGSPLEDDFTLDEGIQIELGARFNF